MAWYHSCEKKGLFHVGGAPLLTGLFGVAKKGKLEADTQLPVLSMIVNAIPANSIQSMIEGDIRALPFFGQWAGIELDEEERVVV